MNRNYPRINDREVRNIVKGVAEGFGKNGLVDSLLDAIEWVNENDPYVKMIDNVVKKAKNHINPTESVKKNMDEFLHLRTQQP